MSWLPPGHWPPMSSPMLLAPTYHPVNGGISHTASALSSPTIVSTSLSQNAVEVVVEQPLLGVAEVGGDGVLGEAALGHLGVGALEGRVDGGHRGVEGVGDLGGRPAQHVAQDQHRPLPGRQVLQRGHEGQPDGVALGDHHGGVGHRLEPGDLVVLLERVAGHLVGGAEPGRAAAGAGLPSRLVRQTLVAIR